MMLDHYISQMPAFSDGKVEAEVWEGRIVIHGSDFGRVSLDPSDTALLQMLLDCIKEMAPELLGFFPTPEESEFQQPAQLVS